MVFPTNKEVWQSGLLQWFAKSWVSQPHRFESYFLRHGIGNSVGRVPDFQSDCRGFEPRPDDHFKW